MHQPIGLKEILRGTHEDSDNKHAPFFRGLSSKFSNYNLSSSSAGISPSSSSEIHNFRGSSNENETFIPKSMSKLGLSKIYNSEVVKWGEIIARELEDSNLERERSFSDPEPIEVSSAIQNQKNSTAETEFRSSNSIPVGKREDIPSRSEPLNGELSEIEVWESRVNKEEIRSRKKVIEERQRAEEYDKWKSDLHLDMEQSLAMFSKEVELWHDMFGMERSTFASVLRDSSEGMNKWMDSFSTTMSKEMAIVETANNRNQRNLNSQVKNFNKMRRKIEQDKTRQNNSNRIERHRRHFSGYNLTPITSFIETPILQSGDKDNSKLNFESPFYNNSRELKTTQLDHKQSLENILDESPLKGEEKDLNSSLYHSSLEDGSFISKEGANSIRTRQSLSPNIIISKSFEDEPHSYRGRRRRSLKQSIPHGTLTFPIDSEQDKIPSPENGKKLKPLTIANLSKFGGSREHNRLFPDEESEGSDESYYSCGDESIGGLSLLETV